MGKITQIIDKWKTEVLQEVCSRCVGACCYNPLTGLSEEQVRTVLNNPETSLENEIEQAIIEQKEDGSHRLIFGHKKSCPQLKRNTCQIYGNSLRPKICEEYPLFIHGKTIVLADEFTCPATSLHHTAQFCLDAMDIGFTIKKGRLNGVSITKKDVRRYERNKSRPYYHNPDANHPHIIK